MSSLYALFACSAACQPASQPVAYLFPDSPNLSSLLFSSCKGPGLFSSIMTIRDLLGTEKQH